MSDLDDEKLVQIMKFFEIEPHFAQYKLLTRWYEGWRILEVVAASHSARHMIWRGIWNRALDNLVVEERLLRRCVSSEDS